MIEVKHIYKSFDGTEVLQDINAVFESGKTNLVIGISGSGKTVLIKCIVGLLKPDRGTVLFNNEEFRHMARNRKKEVQRQIGMLFQGSALFDSLTVEENVMLPLNMFSHATRKEKLDRVNFCLDRVNLQGANKKFPGEISGGMKKRVGIARAIVLNPKYLFCDEPNSGLDPKTSIIIDELIRELTTDLGITTIINTHDMNSVMEIGQNILFLHKGKKAWEGTNEDILTANHEDLDSFIFASDFLREARDKMREHRNLK
jgi:phospholipid/cholesterol/gamma-HCH transport system ATP-binding protein